MSAITCIRSDLTVRQIADAYPACARVLERWHLARWDDRWSLQQLGPFARACGLDEMHLMHELAGAAGIPVESKAKPSRDDSPMRWVFTAIIVGLTLGTGWGVGLLLRIAAGADHAVVPARSVHIHGVAQLWGWLALFVFGVASHVLRQSTRRPAPTWLSGAACAAVVSALLLFFASISAAARAAIPHLELVASSLLALGAIFFAVSALWSLIGRGQRAMLWHVFVLAMVGWLMIWAATDLSLRAKLSSDGQLSDAARSLLIVLPVLGFAANAIYGFGIRLIPGLLNIGRLRPRWFAATLAMHNTGLCCFLMQPLPTVLVGAALMLLAAIVYIAGMNGLRSSPSRPIYGVDPRGHILIRVAFFWLICGLSMVLVQQVAGSMPHAFQSAWRHALTVGFITTMILGVGHRILPVFMRQPLASTRLMLVTAGLIIAGNAGRVTLELATIGGWAWSYRLIGITGVLELTALSLFALNLAATARNRRRIYSAAEPITPGTRVQEAVNATPQIQQRLRELGVTMFDSAPFVAPSMTFGALALAWGFEPQSLVDALNSNSRDVAARPSSGVQRLAMTG